MKRLAFLLLAVLSAAGFSGCAGRAPLRTSYDAVAYKPTNPNNVRIKVSLQNRAVYVMEGDRPLLVTATAIGTPSNPTPTGNFRIFNKIARNRPCHRSSHGRNRARPRAANLADQSPLLFL